MLLKLLISLRANLAKWENWLANDSSRDDDAYQCTVGRTFTKPHDQNEAKFNPLGLVRFRYSFGARVEFASLGAWLIKGHPKMMGKVWLQNPQGVSHGNVMRGIDTKPSPNVYRVSHKHPKSFPTNMTDCRKKSQQKINKISYELSPADNCSSHAELWGLKGHCTPSSSTWKEHQSNHSIKALPHLKSN